MITESTGAESSGSDASGAGNSGASENAASGTPTGDALGGTGGTGDAGATPPAASGTTTDPETGQVVPPAYAPNFKYKFLGIDRNQVEAEIDDLFKPLVKDAATEEKIRKLHEKAYGMDFFKSERDRLKAAFEPMEQKFQSQAQALQTLGAYVKNKDYASFFEALKIPREDILNYALKQVQLAQMTPEQRAEYETQRQAQQRAMALEMQNQQLQHQFQSLSVQQREGELTSAMGKPGVNEAAAAFDQRMGKPGAFRELVIQRGQYHFLSSGVDAPAEQVVSEVLAMIGVPAAAAQPAAATAAGAPVQTSPGRPPVIPHIPGNGASPAKKLPKSTDDLRRLAASMGAGG